MSTLYERVVGLSSGLVATYEGIVTRKHERDVEKEQLAILRQRNEAEAAAQQNALMTQLGISQSLKQWLSWLLIVGGVLALVVAWRNWRKR